jgi:hypothetical protein
LVLDRTLVLHPVGVALSDEDELLARLMPT